MASWSIDSPWLSGFLLLVALLLALRAAPRFGGHCGRTAAGLLLLVAMASYTNAYFGYLPQLGDIVGPRPWPVASVTSVLPGSTTGPYPRGAVVSLPIRGAHSGAPTRKALAYLPPQYFTEPSAHFPVLYLLHGSPGVPLDWLRGGEAAVAGLAAARSGAPVILVAPRMSRGWLDDSECLDRQGFPAESYLVDDVVPTIDAVLRTQRVTAGRGLAGNSAGGYCALAIGLRHPLTFGRVAALSPLTMPTYAYGTLSDLFGHPADLAAVINAHTPAWLLAHQPASGNLRLRLDVGRQDRLAGEVRRFAAYDRSLGGHPDLVLRDGGHTFRVWRPALKDAVLWFSRGSTQPSA